MGEALISSVQEKGWVEATSFWSLAFEGTGDSWVTALVQKRSQMRISSALVSWDSLPETLRGGTSSGLEVGHGPAPTGKGQRPQGIVDGENNGGDKTSRPCFTRVTGDPAS